MVDGEGRLLADREFPANGPGYRRLLDWVAGHGLVQAIGVESTGGYGAGLTRHLLVAGIEVYEVNRPEKTTRAMQGKSDPIDAASAARQVLTGQATGRPKITSGAVEALRMVAVYAGFPAALEAWRVLESIFAARGVQPTGRPT